MKVQPLGSFGATLAVIGLFVLTLGSCCPEDPFSPTPPPIVVDSSRQAYLRVVVGDFDLQPVRARLDGTPMFCAPLGAFDYPEEIYEAQYLPVDTSSSILSFTRTDGSVVASRAVSLPKNTYHTAFLYRNRAGEHEIIITEDDPTATPGVGQIRFRVVNLVVNAPNIDVLFQDNANTSDSLVIRNLGYGDTTEFLLQSNGRAPEFKKMVVTESATGNSILTLPRIAFFGDAVNTLVMVGRIDPTGDQDFLFLNALQDSPFKTTPPTYCDVTVPLLPGNRLYGLIPIPVKIAALRFLNATSSGSETLDLALKSQFGAPFPQNFRRNFPGQESVIQIPALGTGNPNESLPYFFLSTLLESSYPFRVEKHIAPAFDAATVQPILVDAQDFDVVGGLRYTVIAYGPNNPGEAGAVLLIDRTPTPPAGMAAIRFFHGAHGAQQGNDLRLRVNGTLGPAMSYGDAIDARAESFIVSPSSGSRLEVIDPDQNVIATAENVRIEAGKTYLVVLSRGPNGDRFEVSVIDDSVVE